MDDEGGWQTEELAADLWQNLRKLIHWDRLEITGFEMTAEPSITKIGPGVALSGVVLPLLLIGFLKLIQIDAHA